MSETKNSTLGISRVLSFGLMLILPVGGFSAFFSLTRPLLLPVDSVAGYASIRNKPGSSSVCNGCEFVAHIAGVGAQLRRVPAWAGAPISSPAADEIVAVAVAMAGSGTGLAKTDVTATDGRRVAIKLIGRRPAGDEIVSGDAPVLAMTDVSSARVVSFIFNSWLYTVRIEDREPVPELAVYGSL